MIIFSKRHKKLIDQNILNIVLSKHLRRRVYRTLSEFVGYIVETARNGLTYNTNTFEVVKNEYLKLTGEEYLMAYVEDDYKKVDDMEMFILETKPYHVLDIIEIFSKQITPDQITDFILEINEIFRTEETPLRFIEDEFVLLDSDFLESEINSKAIQLLNKGGFEKAYLDFRNARRKLSSNDFDGCIVDANNAIESLLKKILDKDINRQKDLKKELIKTGFIPDYFEGFIEHFDKLLQDAFSIANKTSRHGKKDIQKGKNRVDKHIATFVLNLVGTLIVFISEKHINNLKND